MISFMLVILEDMQLSQRKYTLKSATDATAKCKADSQTGYTYMQSKVEKRKLILS